MLSLLSRFSASRASRSTRGWSTVYNPTCTLVCNPKRFKRYEAFDASADQDALDEARAWYQNFDKSQLPKGNTTYARSSGAGGQHVNKTESKAITVYSMRELLPKLPKELHQPMRASRYYTANSDSLTFHAQTHRSRAMNQEENEKKLVDEVLRIYRENIPAKTSDEKKKKHKEAADKFNAKRLQSKKFTSAKKQARKGPMF